MRLAVAKHAVPGTKRLVQVWAVDYRRRGQAKSDYSFYVAVFEEDRASETGWRQLGLEVQRKTEKEAREVANELWTRERDAAKQPGCCDGTGFTGNPGERCADHYEPCGDLLEMMHVEVRD